MANGDSTRGRNGNGNHHRALEKLEQSIIELYGEITELKMHFRNFLEMRRQIAHMESRYTDRAGGHTGDTRTRQERQKKPRND